MFFACLALKLFLRAFSAGVCGFLPAPLTPFWPNLMSLTVVPDLARTACDLVLCPGVLFGLLYPENFSPARSIAMLILFLVD